MKLVLLPLYSAFALACSQPDASPRSSALPETARVSAPNDTTAQRTARMTAETRYKEHFQQGQGLSIESLRERQAWFAPSLYQRLVADMSQPGGPGVIDFDPFTDAQDDASGFAIGSTRASGDTVFVQVALAFPNGPNRRVTVAMLPSSKAWRIANMLYSDRDLAASLEPPNAPPKLE